MYKINDYVVYQKEVCQIKDINKINNEDYYLLSPVSDNSLLIHIPISNKMGILRDIMSKDKADNLINNISNIKPLSNLNDKYIEKNYQELLSSGKSEDLIKIIKTTYLRNVNRLKNKKKLSDKDLDYFNKAEKYLYNELGIVYHMNFNEIKDYIIKKLTTQKENLNN